MRQDTRIWAGLAEVVPIPGRKVFRKGRGAFANAVGRARDPKEFERRVAKALEQRDLILVELEDVVSVTSAPEVVITADLEVLLSELSRNPQDIIFGSFHTWEKDDISQ